MDHGSRRLWLFGIVGQQFRYRQRRRGPQGGDAGCHQGNGTAGRAFLRHLVRRHSRRGFRASAAGKRRPADAVRLHLQGQWRGRDRTAAQAHRRIARQPAPQARRRHDPLDLHARRASLVLRSGGAGGDHRRRNEIRRSDSERHLSGHGGEFADRRPCEDLVAGADAARRVRRQLDQRRPARFLSAIAERRSPIRHLAADRALVGLRQEPASVVLRAAQLYGGAGADGGIEDMFDRVLEYATHNAAIAKLLLQLGLDPSNLTYHAIFDLLQDMAVDNLTFSNILAFAGGLFLLSTFFVRTIVLMRVLCIFSIVFFLGSAALAYSVPKFLMYLLALPINIVRLVQIRNIVKTARNACLLYTSDAADEEDS